MAADEERPGRPGPSIDQLEQGVVRGDRALLGRAITLVESRRDDHAALAQELLARLLPRSGGARRVGISGVPGVGKSTFIDALGMRLIEEGRRVAVLAVDPSSSISGGSILGDKTRMEQLSQREEAFIRPSPASGTLGGVARRTRETLLLCEAAGFDVVLVETVGVGQSETVVAGMVDFFLVLMLAGGGDELQGIKRGILEIADLIAINKADGDDLARAERARSEYEGALHFIKPLSPNWRPRVVTCSALEGRGLGELWEAVEDHHEIMSRTGELEARRRRQQLDWMWALVEDALLGDLKRHPAVAERLDAIEREVMDGRTTAGRAAQRLLEAYRGGGVLDRSISEREDD